MNSSKSRPWRASFVGGGSGGDTYPVVAVARALKRRVPSLESQYFGSQGGIETRILTDEGCQPILVKALRLKRSTVLKLPFALTQGFLQARGPLAEFAPDFLVAGGGFVSPPVVLAARSLGIPCYLIEPNSVAGRANRFLSRLVQGVFTGYPSAAEDFPSTQVHCLGNPLRFALDPSRVRAPREELVLGVMGGSLGAGILNRAVLENAEWIQSQPLRVVLVTGRAQYPEIQARHQELGRPEKIEVREYQDSMEDFYYGIDLFLGRAGASTCSEVLEFRLPSLLVPRALSVGDHQTKNTRPLAELGLSEVQSEAQFSAQSLRQWLEGFLADPQALNQARAKLDANQPARGDESIAAWLFEHHPPQGDPV